MIMKRTLLILAVLCVSTFAMVPRHRLPREALPNCDPQTPCAWAVYRSPTKVVTMIVDNTYCKCPDDTECSQDADDTTASAYVYKCKKTKDT